MRNKLFTAISGGKYKGKKLLLPPLSSTRSTKSIIKESFFNTVQFEIIQKNFIELFAGSGSMGLEAISRGAKRAYFVEKDENAYEILLQNIASLNVEDKCSAVYGNTFVEFYNIIENIEEKSYFYFDPPFEIRDGMNEIYEKCYQLIKNIPTQKCELIAIEHMSSIVPHREIGSYKMQKSKKFGKTTISYYR